MAGIEQRNPEEDLLFKGKQIDCKKKLLSKNVFLYGGYWKYKEFEHKAAQHGPSKWKTTEQKKEAAIRRIRNEDCVDGWKNMADQLMEFQHNNILRVFGCEEGNGWRYFALEPYSATLYHYCTGEYKGPVPNESQVLYQITSGISHLHSKLIIHGDLNPLNVFIAAQSRPVRMKISDSGLSKFCYSNQLSDDGEYSTRKGLELCQSKYWTQSEQNNPLDKKAVDDYVAAACILFYYLKRGKHLFGNDSQLTLLNFKKKFPANLKYLDETHVAYEPIKNLIFPPSNGLSPLLMAIKEFEKTLSLKVDEKKKLGEGSFGKVYEGKYNGDAVAVKRILTNKSEKKFIQREMKEHVELIHDNVVKLWEVSDSADNHFTHLVLELCAGTFEDYCKNKYKGPKLPPDELVLYQIANGLHYIHSRNLVHRDIKPDNILISMTTPVQMKVSDLSFVKKTRKDIFSQSKIRGTLLWMAPEMLQILNDSDKKLESFPDGTIKSDTFSSGCVFFYLLTRGKHPFGSNATAPGNILKDEPVELDSYKQIFLKDLASNNSIGKSLVDVIEKMIKKEKDERIGLADVIKQLATLLSTMAEIKCQLRRIETPVKGDNCSCFHPTEPILACVDYEGLIFYTAENSSIPFSNWRKEVKLQRQNLHQGFVTSLKWNINGTQLAVGYNDGTLILLNYPKCDIVFQKEHHSRVSGIEWNPISHNVLATFNKKKNGVLILDSLTGDVITKIDCDDVRAVNWISENRIAVSSDNDGGAIHIFEMKENHSIKTTRVLKHGYFCDLEWNERTQYLAYWGGKYIKIWSMDSDEPISLHSLKVENEFISKFAWRPCVRNGQQDDDGIKMERISPENFDFVYTAYDASEDNTYLFTWNPLKNKQKPQLLSDIGFLEELTFSTDGRFLATTGCCGIIIWSAENWKKISNINDVGLSADISWLCTPTSTNLYDNKCAMQSSYVTNVIEFAFEENKNSDSASGTLVESEEDITDLK